MSEKFKKFGTVRMQDRMKPHHHGQGEIFKAPFMLAYENPVTEEQAHNDMMEFSMHNVLNLLTDEPAARHAMRMTLNEMDQGKNGATKKGEDGSPAFLSEFLEYVSTDPHNFVKFCQYWDEARPEIAQKHLLSHVKKLFADPDNQN